MAYRAIVNDFGDKKSECFLKRLQVHNETTLKRHGILKQLSIDVQHVLHKLLFKLERNIRMLPVFAESMTYRLWLWPVKFAVGALGGTVGSEVGIPGCLCKSW